MFKRLFRDVSKRQKNSEAVYLNAVGRPDLERGFAHMKYGNFRAAISAFNRAIQLSPEMPATYHFRGHSYQKLGQPQLALADLTTYLEMMPTDANVLVERSRLLYMDLKEYDAALADATQALTYVEKSSFYVWRSYLYLEKANSENALKDAHRAIEINPKDAVAYNNRGRALLNLGHIDEALADFEHGLILDQNTDVLYLNRGMVRMGQKDFEGAIADYSKYIELTPNARGYFRRGFCYGSLGKHYKALADYDRALRLDPNHHNSLNNKAYELLELGRIAEGLPFAEKAVSLQPHDTVYLHTRGKILAKLDRVEEAVRDYKEALAHITPDDYDVRDEMQEYVAKHAGG